MFGDAVQLVDESNYIGNMFNNMSTDNGLEFVIAERIWKLAKIMKDISMTPRVGIYANRPWEFILPAADIQNPFAGSCLFGC
jgi:hypothetical protein